MDMNQHVKTDSQYLTKDDVDAAGTNLKLAGVTIENVGDDTKPVLHFDRGMAKPMVCNKTNLAILISLFGPESNAWTGRWIQAWNDPTVQYAGQVTGGLRVRPSPMDASGPNLAQNALQEPSDPAHEYEKEQRATAQSMAQVPNDEVPF